MQWSGEGRSAFLKFTKSSPETWDDSTKKELPLIALTVNLHRTFKKCNPKFNYTSSLNPRRVLTDPSEPASNNDCDNAASDLIMAVNDVISGDKKYIILDSLGSGTFGQVVRCMEVQSKSKPVAIKVVKNKPAYTNQGMVEIKILQLLNEKFDPKDECHIVRLLSHFVFKRHLCLCFELLSINLYELIKQNRFCGLSISLIKIFVVQLLEALEVLQKANVIHCDLKPENILLENLTSPKIKLIDFGSACFDGQTVYSYIQSRFYRSPEVILGIPYNSAIDMWSLGCIAAELFLGLPIFPGNSEYDQIRRIINMLGYPPDYMIALGKNGSKFFEKVNKATHRYSFKNEEQFTRDTGIRVPPTKRYFNYDQLHDIINHYPMKKNMSTEQRNEAKAQRQCFINFLHGLLELDPKLRWSATQARQHPFVTGEPFSGQWKPPAPRRDRTLSLKLSDEKVVNMTQTSSPLSPTRQPVPPAAATTEKPAEPGKHTWSEGLSKTKSQPQKTPVSTKEESIPTNLLGTSAPGDSSGFMNMAKSKIQNSPQQPPPPQSLPQNQQTPQRKLSNPPNQVSSASNQNTPQMPGIPVLSPGDSNKNKPQMAFSPPSATSMGIGQTNSYVSSSPMQIKSDVSSAASASSSSSSSTTGTSIPTSPQHDWRRTKNIPMSTSVGFKSEENAGWGLGGVSSGLLGATPSTSSLSSFSYLPLSSSFTQNSGLSSMMSNTSGSSVGTGNVSGSNWGMGGMLGTTPSQSSSYIPSYSYNPPDEKGWERGLSIEKAKSREDKPGTTPSTNTTNPSVSGTDSNNNNNTNNNAVIGNRNNSNASSSTTSNTNNLPKKDSKEDRDDDIFDMEEE